MEYFVAKREYIRRTKFSGHTRTLFAIFILINMFSTSFDNYLVLKLIGVFTGAILLALVVLDKVIEIEVHELLRIEIIDNILNVMRDGSCVFNENVNNVKRAWLEPVSFLPLRLVFELSDHSQHAVKLPVFCKKTQNRLKELVLFFGSRVIV